MSDTKKKVFDAFVTSVPDGPSDGYGRATSNILRVCKDNGIVGEVNNSECKTVIAFHNPTGLKHKIDRLGSTRADKRVIGYTMWETSRLPSSWTQMCNLCDEIWVPSNWCNEVFTTSGVTVPVHTVPIPIDTEAFSFYPRHFEEGPFRFVQYAQMTRRKGWHLTLQAFIEEFGDNEPVKLTIKSRLPVKPEFAVPNNVTFICETWEQNRMLDLLHNSHCFVNPSMGEGFGMCDAEAMATGLPTISTYGHSLAEHLRPESRLVLIDSDVVDVTFDDMQSWLHEFKNNTIKSTWTLPRVDEIRKRMRWAYENRDKLYGEGYRDHLVIKERFSFQNIAPKLLKHFGRVV